MKHIKHLKQTTLLLWPVDVAVGQVGLARFPTTTSTDPGFKQNLSSYGCCIVRLDCAEYRVVGVMVDALEFVGIIKSKVIMTFFHRLFAKCGEGGAFSVL